MGCSRRNGVDISFRLLPHQHQHHHHDIWSYTGKFKLSRSSIIIHRANADLFTKELIKSKVAASVVLGSSATGYPQPCPQGLPAQSGRLQEAAGHRPRRVRRY